MEYTNGDQEWNVLSHYNFIANVGKITWTLTITPDPVLDPNPDIHNSVF